MVERIYKTTQDHYTLKLYIHNSSSIIRNRPAIVFLHGAGFSTNKVRPNQFEHHANHFSSLGFVSICVEYRPLELDGLFSPIKCLKHAKSAIRWIRRESDLLGINPNKIVMAGASAGGYLSLCCAMIDVCNDKSDDLSVSCVPNGLVIFNGGVDAEPLCKMFPDMASDLIHISPIKQVRRNLPPGVFFHGTLDENIPYDNVENFVDLMRLAGNEVRLVAFDGMGHGFFNYGNYQNIPYQRTIKETENFLKEAKLWS
jgi:acetyl esterase